MSEFVCYVFCTVVTNLRSIFVIILLYFICFLTFSPPPPHRRLTRLALHASQFPTCNQVTGHTLVDVSSDQDDDPLCRAT